MKKDATLQVIGKLKWNKYELKKKDFFFFENLTKKKCIGNTSNYEKFHDMKEEHT